MAEALKKITKNNTIGEVIAQKGTEAGKMMDELFCEEEGNLCCPGTTLCISFASELRDINPVDLSNLLARLNELPDITR